MRRAESAERAIMDARRRYEADHDALPDHWVDLTQTAADGCQSSEIDVPEDCQGDLMDTVKDDVELGIKLGQKMKPGQDCFSATVTDSDGRSLHFFFIDTSEHEVVGRLIEAYTRKVD